MQVLVEDNCMWSPCCWMRVDQNIAHKEFAIGGFDNGFFGRPSGLELDFCPGNNRLEVYAKLTYLPAKNSVALFKLSSLRQSFKKPSSCRWRILAAALAALASSNLLSALTSSLRIRESLHMSLPTRNGSTDGRMGIGTGIGAKRIGRQNDKTLPSRMKVL
jgi:hypothetical protein